MTEPEAASPFPGRLVPGAFAALDGWAGDDHAAAFRAFRSGAAVLADHPPKPRASGIDADALAAQLRRAAALPEDLPAPEGRRFFEDNFVPHRVEPLSGTGFFTGYYEPIVEGSLQRTGAFPAPLYGVPDDLIEFDPADPPPGIDPTLRLARRTAGGLAPYPDRAAIEDGLLAGRNLELVWLADPVDAFFIQVQGAARIRLTHGGTLRVTYAAKTGHPYTPIGRVLIEMGAIEKGAVTMQSIRAWLAAHPAEARTVMQKNRSFVFFREAAVADEKLGPVAAAKVPLTEGRSLAVDRILHSFHTPVFIGTRLPDGTPFRRLMVAHDTGSAIVGPARGDIFFGSGDAAGAVAGAMRSEGQFVILVPRRP
jgi:membrane-bound lytic murein transglycosylase A